MIGNNSRAAALMLAVEYIYAARVEGDLIEFGVYNGWSASILANAMRENEVIEPDYPKDRKLWLCDSFEGFPAADNKTDKASPMVSRHIWGEGMSRGVPSASFRDNPLPVPQEIVEGWYKDTWPTFTAPGCRYALVHADCDLYGSTIDALHPLFRKKCIAPGCIVLLDDWNGNHAAREFGQRKAWAELVAEFEIDASDEGGYGSASHRFIVHNYR